MKRELKQPQSGIDDGALYCRAYPDEKGIETQGLLQLCQNRYREIAEPIPMKRELKLRSQACFEATACYCRAYPDEKGIETAR